MGTIERRQREKSDLRRAILDAARELFVAQGYESVSLRKIAERIEYTPPTIYLHFKDKDEILGVLAEEGFRLLAERLEKIEKQFENPVERLLEGSKVYFGFAQSEPHYYNIMFELRANVLLKGGNTVTPHETCGYRAFGFIERAVEQGLAQKLIVPTASAEVLAHTIWASIHGAVSLLLAGRLGMLSEDAQKLLFLEVTHNTIRGMREAS